MGTVEYIGGYMKVNMMRRGGDIHVLLENGNERVVPLVQLVVWASATKLEATTSLRHSSGRTACQRIRELLELPRNITKAKCATYATELRIAPKKLPDQANAA